MNGAVGPAGPAGPPGVITSVTASAQGTNPNSTTALFTVAFQYDFVGPTVSVTPTTAGQKVHLVSVKAMGTTTAGGAAGLRLTPCFKLASAAATVQPTPVGSGLYDHQVPQNTRIDFTVNTVIPTGAGGLTVGSAYNIGMCAVFANANGGTNWNSNDYGYTSAILTAN